MAVRTAKPLNCLIRLQIFAPLHFSNNEEAAWLSLAEVDALMLLMAGSAEMEEGQKPRSQCCSCIDW